MDRASYLASGWEYSRERPNHCSRITHDFAPFLPSFDENAFRVFLPNFNHPLHTYRISSNGGKCQLPGLQNTRCHIWTNEITMKYFELTKTIRLDFHEDIIRDTAELEKILEVIMFFYAARCHTSIQPMNWHWEEGKKQAVESHLLVCNPFQTWYSKPLTRNSSFFQQKSPRGRFQVTTETCRKIMHTHRVFPPFLDCIFGFGYRTEEDSRVWDGFHAPRIPDPVSPSYGQCSCSALSAHFKLAEINLIRGWQNCATRSVTSRKT